LFSNQIDKINHVKDCVLDCDRCNFFSHSSLETITSKVFSQTLHGISILARSIRRMQTTTHSRDIYPTILASH